MEGVFVIVGEYLVMLLHECLRIIYIIVKIGLTLWCCSYFVVSLNIDGVFI